MALGDKVYISKVSDFNLFEDFDIFEHYDSPSIDSSESFEYLCVPQDPLHEVFETFPSITSTNKPISWSDLGINPDFENISFGESFHNFKHKVQKEEEQEDEEIKNVKMIDSGLSGFAKRKPRTKRFWQKVTKKNLLFSEADQLKNKEKIGDLKKCTHCQVEKTPQWRTGPLGPKTLCNACGVRFKSGRLLQEYRPAASPEFDGKKYFNFHRKLMRSKCY